MSNPEAKEVFVPFPIDPNKYEINKWMAQAGLPVPRIFPSAEEAQEALKSGIQIMARGYLVDNRVSRERPYCADELLIDVLQTECFDIETVSYFKKEIIRLTEEGNSLLTSPGLITYCHEVGINPADLRAKYFFQERIIPPNKEFPISVLTGNFTLDNISVEVQQSGHQYGNFFYSEHGMQSGNQKWDISARAGFELHCQAQPLLEAANGYKFWHMEMVPNFNDNTSDEIEQIFLVQARRIPAKEIGRAHV